MSGAHVGEDLRRIPLLRPETGLSDSEENTCIHERLPPNLDDSQIEKVKIPRNTVWNTRKIFFYTIWKSPEIKYLNSICFTRETLKNPLIIKYTFAT